MPLPSPKFGDGQKWDGTTPESRPTTDVYKDVDAEIGNRHSAEIIALEELLCDVIDVLELLKNPGAANSILGVKNDQLGFEYKTLIQGTGITLTHNGGNIVLSAVGGISGIAGESLVVGDVLYNAVDGKVYKALAHDEVTSKVIGCSNVIADTDDFISIVSFGTITNSSWTLTPGFTYYLSLHVAGAFVSTPPELIGQYLVPIGIALSSTQLIVNLQKRTRL